MFICGDMNFIEETDLNYLGNNIQNYLLPYASNTYITRQTLEYVLKENEKNFFLLLWSDSDKEEWYNKEFGYVTFHASKSLIIYHKDCLENKQYYIEDFQEHFQLNFLKKQLYTKLNKQALVFMKKYKNNKLYNEFLKILHMISLFEILTIHNHNFLFIFDNMMPYEIFYDNVLKNPKLFNNVKSIVEQFEYVLTTNKVITYNEFYHKLRVEKEWINK